jgi:hypothetical protein
MQLRKQSALESKQKHKADSKKELIVETSSKTGG